MFDKNYFFEKIKYGFDRNYSFLTPLLHFIQNNNIAKRNDSLELVLAECLPQNIMIHKRLKIIDSFLKKRNVRYLLFNIAIEEGYTEIIDILLKNKKFNPQKTNFRDFIVAVDKGYVDIVKILLNKFDPTIDDGWALRLAVINKNKDMAQLLLEDKRIDPTIWNNAVFRYAAENDLKDIVGLFVSDGRLILDI